MNRHTIEQLTSKLTPSEFMVIDTPDLTDVLETLEGVDLDSPAIENGLVGTLAPEEEWEKLLRRIDEADIKKHLSGRWILQWHDDEPDDGYSFLTHVIRTLLSTARKEGYADGFNQNLTKEADSYLQDVRRKVATAERSRVIQIVERMKTEGDGCDHECMSLFCIKATTRNQALSDLLTTLTQEEANT
jgi:hypothetical protein